MGSPTAAPPPAKPLSFVRARAGLRRFTGVQPGEEPSAFLIFLFVAIVVASFVLARAVRNGLFLAEWDAHRLVYIYVAVPVLLLVFAPLHTFFAGRSGQRAVITFTLAFFVLNVLAFWLLFRLQPRPVLSALFYVWVNCYGIIASFQAWGFATSVFDTRQAKRLFGLIGAGAPLGAVLGGLLARVLVGPLGATNLLLVLATLIALAALLVNLTLRVIPRRTPAVFEPRPVQLLPRTLGVVSRSGYLRAIAALVFLVAIVTQWTQFQFLLVAQERYARDADRLTAFLGEWNVYFGIVAFLVQVLFTGPALRRFGVALTVFLLPAALGLGSGLIVLFPVFWAVLLTSSLDQSLRFSIDKATFELLYLPLPASVRGGVKATIDIVFSRAADAFGGVLLGLATDGFRLGFLSLPGAGLGVRGLAVVNLGLIAVWALVALDLRRGYVNAIRESLQRHGLDAETTTSHVVDRSTTEVLASRLESRDETELLYTLDLLERHHGAPAHPALRLLLEHETPAVRRRALSLLDAAGDRTVAARAFELLRDPDLETRTAALAYLAHHADLDPLRAIQSLGDFAECSVRAGMVSFLARPGRSQNLEAAHVLLDAMVAEPDPEGRSTRLEAARLTGTLPPGFGRALGRLLRDADLEVARFAIRAVGAQKRAEFVPELLARLAQPQLSDDAERSLAALGDAALPPLRDLLFDAATSLEVKREIPAVLVRLGTPEAQRALMESLLHHDPTLRRRVIASLMRLRRRQPQLHLEPELLETVLAAEITGHYRSHQVLERLGHELHGDDSALAALRHSLEEERDRIFGLLALLGGGDDLQSAHRGLRSDDVRTRANALELLDNVLKPALRRLVVPLVDPHVSVAERAELAVRLLGTPLQSREEAVAVLAACGDAWLRSCAARIIASLDLRGFGPDLARWTEDVDPLLREAARAARRQIQEGAARDAGEAEALSEGAGRLGVG